MSAPTSPPRAALLTIGAALVLGAACRSSDPFALEARAVLPEAGAVVCEHPLATVVGLEVLEAGGNAADAAVATALALAVVFPQAGNLGGGGFVVWSPHEGEPVTLDFREVAPAGYRAQLYLGADGEVVRSRSLSTPLAVGVPGSPAGLFELYRLHGSQRLSFGQLAEGAIALAENGFTVDPWLARTLRSSGARERLEADPGAAALFYPGGEPLAEGDRLVQPRLAATLRVLAQRGPAGFYRGAVADAIVADLREADARAGRVAGPALLDLDDLAGYEVVERVPVVGSFRGSTVVSMGPPSSGGVALLQVLGILEGVPLEEWARDRRWRAEVGLAPVDEGGDGIDARALHWWIEAMRRAFADRARHLGDPGSWDVPVAALLDPDYLAERRMSIGERADPDVGPLVLAPREEGPQTTHLSVVDADGNAVSLTTTLNASFGSGIYVDGGGFLLNNELDDFSIKPGTPNLYGLVGGEANQLAPGRRPLSSMTPTVVRDARTGRLELALGAPGGPRIITAVTQVVLRVLAYGQDIETAVRGPRVHQQWRPRETRIERGFPPDVVDALARAHGHPLREPEPPGFGSVQAIHVGADGRVEAFSDARRGGAAGVVGRGVARPALPPR